MKLLFWGLYLIILIIALTIFELLLKPNSWWMHLLLFLLSGWIATGIGGIADPKGDS